MEENSKKTSPCKECGTNSVEALLQSEVVHLRQHLASAESCAAGAQARLLQVEEQRATWRDKYERLYESHKRVQKLNQNLEEKLLGMVDKCKADKSQLTKDIATLSVRLAETKHAFSRLDKENERYKNDMNLAIQLLQCKPDNFVSQKLDTLPVETQARVSQYILSKTKGNTSGSSNGSQTKGENETFEGTEFEFNISASLMAKILEDSVQDTVTKHCDTCTCEKQHNKPFSFGQSCYSVGTQADQPQSNASLCINCNSEIKSVYSTLTNESHPSPPCETLNAESSVCQKTSPIHLMRHEAKKHINYSKKLTHKSDPINDNHAVMNDDDRFEITAAKHKEIVNTIGENLKELNLKNNFMEPLSHHKLCDRTKVTTKVEKSYEKLVVDDVKDETQRASSPPGNSAATFLNTYYSDENRKNSIESNGANSGTSSVAKSNASTHKSNTHVGPGPRFCSLRVQAGSKNILLDNAQPHVPPVLYTRHNTGPHSQAISEIVVDTDKTNQIANALQERRFMNRKEPEDILIDVETLDNSGDERNVNPAFVNVPLSPLRPRKVPSPPESTDGYIHKRFNKLRDLQAAPNNSNNVKVFNFNDYELRTSDLNLSNHIEKFDKSPLSKKITANDDFLTTSLPTDYLKKYKNVKFEQNGIINNNDKQSDAKEPNLNGKEVDSKTLKVRAADKSISSGSSEDGATRLQRQQLHRVALWLRQHHTVPHPVTKYRHLPQTTTGTMETSFPADIQAPTQTTHKESGQSKAVSSEELARMEYNVKQFLLQQWIPSESTPAQTSSTRTETDL